jgi:hypothetical protein
LFTVPNGTVVCSASSVTWWTQWNEYNKQRVWSPLFCVALVGVARQEKVQSRRWEQKAKFRVEDLTVQLLWSFIQYFLRSVGTYQPNCTVSYGRGTCYYCRNFTYYMRTNSMGRLYSWEADSSLSDQEISHTLQVPEVYYFVHRPATLVSVLRQINPLHASPPYFLKIYVNL